MAYTTIDDGSAYFHAQLFTGNDATDRAITNDANAGDFKPDLLWLKNRDSASTQMVFDSSRLTSSEATLSLRANATNAEADKVDVFGGFETDGFTVDGSDSDTNSNGHKFVAWQWKANGGTTASNTAGDITTTVQANTTAGFSIFTYTGTGTDGDTIGHGLGAVPNWIWIKARSIANDQTIYHSANTSAPETEFLAMQGTDATSDSSTRWSDTAPTSTLITLGNNAGVNGNTYTYVGYAFAEKQGYSKFGKYTGNNDADGTFVYTGFKPAWLMVKRSSAVQGWLIWDSKRASVNTASAPLTANETSSEDTPDADLLSNGFKLRTADTSNNAVSTYIYMAFAEHPFVSSEGVPTTAR